MVALLSKDYWEYAHSQLASDDADSVIVTVVCCFPFLILMMGWSLDFAKNVVVRSDLEEIALESVQSAIRAQDGVGGIECTNTDWLTRDGAVNAVKSGGRGSSKVGASTKLALKTYLMKTGRADSTDFVSASSDEMKGNVYNDKDTAKANLASNADYAQVATYRQLALADGEDLKTADADTGYTAFRIKITCGKAADRKSTLSDGEKVSFAGDYSSRGVAGKLPDQITIQVKDWCGNFFLGNPITNQHYAEDTTINFDPDIGISTSTRNVQRFEISKSAISAWSQSTFNKKS